MDTLNPKRGTELSGYRRELAADLTLADLHRFTERFLTNHRRQLQTKGDFLEFIVPDVLKPFGLPERYREATFDRELAIKRSDASSWPSAIRLLTLPSPTPAPTTSAASLPSATSRNPASPVSAVTSSSS